MKSLLRIYGSICRDGVLKQSKITYPNIKSHFLANNFKHQQIRWKRVVRVNPLQAIKEVLYFFIIFMIIYSYIIYTYLEKSP